jgi:serine phosphatase RsbU (regulator of sigma subunit)
VGPLLRAGPPDRLVEVLTGWLETHHEAKRAEVLLADYTLSGLRPVGRPGEPAGEPLDSATSAARCFASQYPVIDRGAGEHRLHLPLTAWGERVGVLVVRFGAAPRPERVAALAATAAEFATALRAADRDTDRYRVARRRARLTMAAELQWDLLPGRCLADDRFTLAGQLEPAYAVCGDHFDWALNGDQLTVTVLNGHGGGLAASLLTSLAVNAMRNARRSGAGIVEQAGLASAAVFAEFGGARHAATLLMEIDLVTGQVEAVDAGSPRALLVRGAAVQPITLEQQLPIGMFGDADYQPERLALAPGDRLLVVSDGVHAASPGGRAPFGESALLAAVRRTRLQPAPEAVGTVMRGLHEYHADHDPDDDAVIICLDLHGRSEPSGGAGPAGSA